MVMCQVGSSVVTNVSQLLEGVANGRGCACVGVGTWAVPMTSAQFFCEPKTDLKNKAYFVSGGERWLSLRHYHQVSF